MKKKLIALFIVVAMFACLIPCGAFACDNCLKDSTPYSGVGAINGTNVSLRPHHNTTVPAGGYVNTDDMGNITHLYPSSGNTSWIRMEMTSGQCQGLNGWVYSQYVLFYI